MPGGTAGNETGAIARAAGVVGFLTLLSRITGLARDAVIGYLFGSGAAADAFFVAFRIPNLLRRFVAEGAMTVAFIPIFSEYVTQRGPREALRAARAVGTAFTVLLVGVTAVGIGTAPWWAVVLAPGFAAEPGKLELTVALTRLVFPYILLISLVALLGGILNAFRHFAAPALAPLFFNLTVIATASVLWSRVHPPIYALAYGVLAGGVVQIAAQLPPLRSRGLRLWPLWQPRHDALVRSMRLIAPITLGAAIYQINVMVGTILASTLPSGAVSYLWYAGRVFEFPLGIVAVALGTAALPSFSRQAARGDFDALAGDVAFAVRLTSAVAVPAAVGIVILAHPITAVLFQRGAFSAADVRFTAQALAAFGVGLWSVSVARVLVPAFYAMRDVRTPLAAAIASFVANIVFSVMCMGAIPAGGGSRITSAIAATTAALGVIDLRHAGLALAASLAATVNLLLLAVALRRRLPTFHVRTILPGFGRSLAAAGAMAVPVAAIARTIPWDSGPFGLRLGVLTAAIAAGMALYALVSWMLGSPEMGAAARATADRLRRLRSPAPPGPGCFP